MYSFDYYRGYQEERGVLANALYELEAGGEMTRIARVLIDFLLRGEKPDGESIPYDQSHFCYSPVAVIKDGKVYISYFPSEKAIELDKRREASPYKFISSMNYKFDLGIDDDYELREFVDELLNEMVIPYQYEVIRGREIVREYCREKYGSCMFKNASVEFYAANENAVGQVLIKDEDGEIVGRALLWNTDDGGRFLDRIHPDDDGRHVRFIRDVAEKEGWDYKADGNSYTDFDTAKGENYRIRVKDVGAWPYMDTMAFMTIESDGYCILSNHSGEEDANLQKVFNADYLELCRDEQPDINETNGSELVYPHESAWDDCYHDEDEDEDTDYLYNHFRDINERKQYRYKEEYPQYGIYCKYAGRCYPHNDFLYVKSKNEFVSSAGIKEFFVENRDGEYVHKEDLIYVEILDTHLQEDEVVTTVDDKIVPRDFPALVNVEAGVALRDDCHWNGSEWVYGQSDEDLTPPPMEYNGVVVGRYYTNGHGWRKVTGFTVDGGEVVAETVNHLGDEGFSVSIVLGGYHEIEEDEAIKIAETPLERYMCKITEDVDASAMGGGYIRSGDLFYPTNVNSRYGFAYGAAFPEWGREPVFVKLPFGVLKRLPLKDFDLYNRVESSSFDLYNFLYTADKRMDAKQLRKRLVKDGVIES